MNKSTHEETLSQTLQTDNKQFERSVSFLTGYNGIINVKNKNNYFHAAKTFTDKGGYIQKAIQPCAYELESLDVEIRRIVSEEEQSLKQNFHSQ